ncbi:hypothetical protein AB1N83_013304, partial [Pleurotus pulmonarius]
WKTGSQHRLKTILSKTTQSKVEALEDKSQAILV